MKNKILMLVCAFCFVIPAVLFGLTACGTKDTANSEKSGLQYKLINDGTEYSVVDLDDYDKLILSIPATYKNKPVTTIDARAFKDSVLTDIIIPNSVTTIAEGAFHNSSLFHITIPSSVTTIGEDAFGYCFNLDEVNYTGDINDWVSINFADECANPLFYGAELKINYEIVTTANITATQVKPYAFHDYDYLTGVILGENIVSIGDFAFFDCTNLETVNILSECLTTIGEHAFYKTNKIRNITIPRSVRTIGEYAFYRFSEFYFLEEVNYAGDINDWMLIDFANDAANPAFNSEKIRFNGEELTTVNITATEIKPYVFAGLKSLTNIILDESAKTIGEGAFKGCSNLDEINYTGDINDWVSINFADASANPINSSANLNSSVKLKINDEIVTTANISATEVKAYALYNCHQLTSVELENGVTIIGEEAFYYCKNMESVTFANTVITINDGAFSSCRALTSVTIGNNVATIGEEAFRWCDALASVLIGNNVTTIGDMAFEGCDNLVSMSIGKNVSIIGSNAFYNCSALATVIIDSETIANLLENVYSCEYLINTAQTIYVKAGLSVSNSTYLLLNYTKQVTSDKDGYDMYVKNA